jgi:hypothetical protein
VRAAPGEEVRVAALDREVFIELMGESDLLGDELDEVMRARLENIARRQERDDA